MATIRHTAILVVATLAVLVIGSADAWKCPSGYKDCNPHKRGCETCIRNDVNNCGDCRKKCKVLPYTTVKCENHKCVYTCKPGWADCDRNMHKNGCETDIGKDPNHCGGCRKKCQSFPYTTAKCHNKNCVYTCKPGRGDCDNNLWKTGCETDIGKDPNHCGGCGQKCQDFPHTIVKCNGKYCTYTCKPGRSDCDRALSSTGCETDSANDVNNCGACRNVCKVTLKGGEATCKNGQCGQQCKTGTKFDKHKNCCVPA